MKLFGLGNDSINGYYMSIIVSTIMSLREENYYTTITDVRHRDVRDIMIILNILRK